MLFVAASQSRGSASFRLSQPIRSTQSAVYSILLLCRMLFSLRITDSEGITEQKNKMSYSGIIEMDLRSLANEVKKKGALFSLLISV